jgi:hypothetical protein
VTTLKAARADLAAKIATATAAYDPTVLAFDPPTVSGETVTVSTAGVAPTDWLLFVRVYVPTIQSQAGQDRLDDLVVAAETVGESISPTPRSNWEFVYDESKECFLMMTTVAYPREDF